MKDVTASWLEHVKEDLDVAHAALERSRTFSCVSHCQQALEKALKALWLEQNERNAPPRTHNLRRLSDLIRVRWEDEKDLAFLDDLSAQYGPSRYPDVRPQTEYSREDAEYYLDSTERLIAWLLQQMS